MTRKEAIARIEVHKVVHKMNEPRAIYISEALDMAIKALEQEPCEDAISRDAAIDLIADFELSMDQVVRGIHALPPVTPQEPKTKQYEKHIDHTDCIWYGSDSVCPATCSQYRDGWNDAMDYIFKNGKGYQPYRHDG